MARKSNKGLMIGLGVVAAAGIAGVAMASGREQPAQPKPEPKPTPTPTPQPKPPKKAPKTTAPDRPKVSKPDFPQKGGGKIWRDPKLGPGRHPAGPKDFDFAGNGIWIAPDCSEVWEGAKFFVPDRAAEFPTLAETLAYMQDTDDPNSAAGYAAYLTLIKGYNPAHIVWQIVTEVRPSCGEVENPEEDWGDGLAFWYADFLDRLIPWWEEETNKIYFSDEA